MRKDWSNEDLEQVGSADGYSVDGDVMHWTVDCPKCDKEYEFTGYYDNGDTLIKIKRYESICKFFTESR